MDSIRFLNIEYLFYQIYLLTQGTFDTSTLVGTLANIWAYLTLVSIVISLVLIALTVYAANKGREVRRLEEARFHTEGALFEVERKNARWEQILAHVNSDNPNDWRLAIIEADIILDELVKNMGYHGETLGERMKGIEQSDFTSIEAAWEAHKIRNRIAHSGSDFILTQRETRRVISLFEQVFKEFEYI